MTVQLRRAVLYRDGSYDGADMGVMYECRNDEDTRRFSRNKGPIAWEKHKQWFQRELRERPESLWMGDVNGVSVGYIRQQLQTNDRSLISVALLPGFRGKGYGVELIKAMAAKIVADGRIPTAHILPFNTVSAKAFLAAGFAPVKMLDGDIGFESRIWVYEWKANGRRSDVLPVSTKETPIKRKRRGVVRRLVQQVLGAE